MEASCTHIFPSFESAFIHRIIHRHAWRKREQNTVVYGCLYFQLTSTITKRHQTLPKLIYSDSPRNPQELVKTQVKSLKNLTEPNLPFLMEVMSHEQGLT